MHYLLLSSYHKLAQYQSLPWILPKLTTYKWTALWKRSEILRLLRNHLKNRECEYNNRTDRHNSLLIIHNPHCLVSQVGVYIEACASYRLSWYDELLVNEKRRKKIPCTSKDVASCLTFNASSILLFRSGVLSPQDQHICCGWILIYSQHIFRVSNFFLFQKTSLRMNIISDYAKRHSAQCFKSP